MLKITQRDRIFAAIAIPAALLAAYIFLVRAPLARSVGSMRDRLASLGDADTLRSERTVLDRRLAEGREALRAAEEAESARRAAELADGTAAPADASARLRRATSILGEHLRITSSKLLAEGDSASPSAPLVREAIGGQPATLWRFTAVATYPSVVAALRAISAQSLPVVTERAILEAPPASSTPSARTWQLDICL